MSALRESVSFGRFLSEPLEWAAMAQVPVVPPATIRHVQSSRAVELDLLVQGKLVVPVAAVEAQSASSNCGDMCIDGCRPTQSCIWAAARSSKSAAHMGGCELDPGKKFRCKIMIDGRNYVQVYKGVLVRQEAKSKKIRITKEAANRCVLDMCKIQKWLKPLPCSRPLSSPGTRITRRLKWLQSSDCLSLIHKLQSSGFDKSSIDAIIQDIKIKASMFLSC